MISPIWLQRKYKIALLCILCLARQTMQNVINLQTICQKITCLLMQDDNARFPQLWADIPRERSKRTTNGPEAFHSHFNGQFYSTHPSIFTFIDVITKLQTTTYVKMRCLNVDAALRKPEKERISFLLRQFEMYSVGELNRYQYIKSIGFKFAARTDL